MKRRQILLTGLASAAFLGVAPRLARAQGQAPPVYDDDRILGSADAPITIVEYSSLTCPHCANFHKNTLPQLKDIWIDTGRARLVYRHFPFDGAALRAALVANCLEGKRHFTFLDALFRGQDLWARAPDPVAALKRIAGLAGLSPEKFEACVDDKEEMQLILARMQEARDTYGVNSTPTFFINGRKVTGAVSFEEFEKVLKQVQSDT
jgi:protein-disulfide isomerase